MVTMNSGAPYFNKNLSFLKKDLEVSEYHAHVYFNPQTQANTARILHDEAEDLFTKRGSQTRARKITVTPFKTNPFEPYHNLPEFEIKVSGQDLGLVSHYLSKNRRGLTVMIHDSCRSYAARG